MEWESVVGDLFGRVKKVFGVVEDSEIKASDTQHNQTSDITCPAYLLTSIIRSRLLILLSVDIRSGFRSFLIRECKMVRKAR